MILRVRRWLGLVVVAATLCLALGCDEPRNYGITVVNETEHQLYLRVVTEDNFYRLGGSAVEPGSSLVVIVARGAVPESDLIIGKDRCLLGDLVAVTPDEREIARQPPPVCLDPNYTWVIGENAPST